MTLSKETIRYEATRHRNRINPLDENENPEKACDLFFDALRPEKGSMLAGYWPKEREFDPRYILERASGEGIRCALPVVEKGSLTLRFAEWTLESVLVEGAFGIMQPEKSGFVTPDIVLVPLLAFDLRGYRIGYGGGYYDATLQSLRREKPGIVAVGVCYAAQAVIFNLPTEEHDERLDWVVTPQKAHFFE
jgi:5-formyltetrahydrofolate cyclo-ligase